MGEVFVLFKISVEDMEKFDEIKNKVKEVAKPKEIREEDIGFGLKVLKALVIMNDDAGMSEMENKLLDIEGVSSVDVEDMGRL